MKPLALLLILMIPSPGICQHAYATQPVLPESVKVSARVLLPDGKPAPNARVYFGIISGFTGKETPGQLVLTNSAGRATAEVPVSRQHTSGIPSVIGVASVIPGKAVGWSTMPLNSNEPQVTIKLKPGVNLTGRAMRLDAKPLAGVVVRVSDLETAQMIRPSPEMRGDINPLTMLLKPHVTRTLFQARTGPDGSFTLKSLPPDVLASLEFGDGIHLTSGSAAPVVIGRKDFRAGLFFGTRHGAVRLKLVHRKTGKPAAGIHVGVVPKSRQSPFQQSFIQAMDMETMGRPPVTDAKGEMLARNLSPGEYLMRVLGHETPVTIEAGKTCGPIEVKVRTGPLKGRLLDTSGKPAAGIAVMIDVPSDPARSAMLPFMHEGAQNARTRTGPDGRFEIPAFEFGSPEITIRAVRENDEAMWTGAGEDLGENLTLRLVKDARVTVTGRLVDTRRKPLPRGEAAAIRWRDAPRIAWFNSAKPAKIDESGRFKVVGLERGEPFSIISGSSFTRGPEAVRSAFETPRFITESTGAVQDLGEVVVHPFESSDEVIQLYGFDSREQLARFGGLIPAPSPDEVAAARRNLSRYAEAVAGADIDTVHRLTSRVTTGWSPERAKFLAQASIRMPADSSALRPMRFVGQFAVAYLHVFNSAGENFSDLFSGFGKAAREAEANPNWLVLAERDVSGVRIGAVMHQEGGEWKLVHVTAQPFATADELFLGQSFLGRRPFAPGFDVSAPQPGPLELEAARSVATKFLRAWSADREADMHRLLSPVSPSYAEDIAAFHKALQRRLDEGSSPLEPGEEVMPAAIDGMTVWDLEWLASHVRTLDQFGGARSERPADLETKFPGFPARFAARGELVPFAYGAGDRRFMILMVKHGKGWKVLEPALPM